MCVWVGVGVIHVGGCMIATRVDGQSDPSPRSTSPLDGELSPHAGGVHHHARKSPVSTDHMSSGGMHSCLLYFTCGDHTYCT